MLPLKLFISVFGVISVSLSVQGRDIRVIKDQIATATSQSNRHDITRQSTNQQRPAIVTATSQSDRNDITRQSTNQQRLAISSYEDYNRDEISSSSSRQKIDQPRLTQHNFQGEEKRVPTSIRNGQSVSSIESSRPTRPISFHIGSHNQRSPRQRRPLRVRLRQYNQSKDEPREYSRPAFDRSKYRNNSPSSPNSYSFANSNIFISNGNQESSTQEETHHNSQDIWHPTAGPNVYSSSTLITLSTPPTTPKKINSNKNNDDKSNLEVRRMTLISKRLEEQEENRKPKNKDSNLETSASRYTSSYSKVSMNQSTEAPAPKYIRPPKVSTALSSTLRSTLSSTVKITTVKPTPTSNTDHPNLKNSPSIEGKIEKSTLQLSASAPQSINISTSLPIKKSTDIIHTTAAPVHIVNITTTKTITHTAAALTENPIKGSTDISVSGNFTISDIYKNAPVSPARLATLGNFNLLGFGGLQQQKKFFQPQSSSLLGGVSSQGGLSNLFDIGSLTSLGGLGHFDALNLAGSTSHSTDNFAKSSGLSGGNLDGLHRSSLRNTGTFAKSSGSSGGSLDGLHRSSLGSDTSDLGVASLFGGNLGSFGNFGFNPSIFGASVATTPKSNIGDLDYLSILSNLGGLSGFGGLGAELGSLGGYGGLGGLSGTSGLSQHNTHSPSLSLSSLGLGGSISQQNQSPNPSSGLNILSSFPNVNLAGIGGLSSFPSLTGRSNIGKNSGIIPSLASAAVPRLPAISSIPSVSNVPGTQELVPSSKAAVSAVSEPLSVAVETVKAVKK